MAGPIYKLWMSKPNGAWYELSEEERKGYIAKLIQALDYPRYFETVSMLGTDYQGV